MKFSFAGIKSEFLASQSSLIQRIYNASGVAPHALTQRWIYTVPAAKRAKMNHAFVQVLRQTAAGAAGQADIQLFLDTTNLLLDSPIPTSFGAGGFGNLAAPDSVDLPAGSVVELYTVDASTGGTIRYIGSATFTEYDA